MSWSRVEKITRSAATFIQSDIRISALFGRIFSEHTLIVGFHFAGLKAVGEGVSQPLRYFATTCMAASPSYGPWQMLAFVDLCSARLQLFMVSQHICLYLKAARSANPLTPMVEAN